MVFEIRMKFITMILLYYWVSILAGEVVHRDSVMTELLGSLFFLFSFALDVSVGWPVMPGRK
jgi:hypothetical protein